MANKHLNVERFDSKVASSAAVSIPWQLNGCWSRIQRVNLEDREIGAGRPVLCSGCGQWLDEGTVPYRAGVPDPNVFPDRKIGCISENIGDYSGDTCNGEMVEFLTLHGSVYELPTSGDTESTPHTTQLICQQVTR